mgnify:CR=1
FDNMLLGLRIKSCGKRHRVLFGGCSGGDDFVQIALKIVPKVAPLQCKGYDGLQKSIFFMPVKALAVKTKAIDIIRDSNLIRDCIGKLYFIATA